jgi:hypothetical protein
MKRLKGLYSDCEPINQPEGTYRDAKNIDILTSVGAIKSDIKPISIGATYDKTILGHVTLSDNRVIIFAKDNTNDYIDIVAANGAIFNEFTGDLNFTNKIQARFKLNNKSEYLIFFVDGDNPPRVFNLSDTLTNDYDFNLFRNITPANITLGQVFNTGGNLKTGTYYVAMAYADDDGNRTGFFNITRGIAIKENSEYGALDSGKPTTKSFSLNITGLDTTSSYNRLKLAVIYQEGGTFDEVRLLPPISFNSASTVVTISGTSTYTISSLEEILIDSISYEKADAIEIYDDFLYLGGLTSDEDVNLQSIANDVIIESYEEKLEKAIETSGNLFVESTNSYRNSDIIYNKTGFKRGEVYAFYIAFLKKNGTYTKAFHIPGRKVANIGKTPSGEFEFNKEVLSEENSINPSASFVFKNTLLKANESIVEGGRLVFVITWTNIDGTIESRRVERPVNTNNVNSQVNFNAYITNDFVPNFEEDLPLDADENPIFTVTSQFVANNTQDRLITIEGSASKHLNLLIDFQSSAFISTTETTEPITDNTFFSSEGEPLYINTETSFQNSDNNSGLIPSLYNPILPDFSNTLGDHPDHKIGEMIFEYNKANRPLSLDPVVGAPFTQSFTVTRGTTPEQIATAFAAFVNAQINFSSSAQGNVTQMSGASVAIQTDVYNNIFSTSFKKDVNSSFNVEISGEFGSGRSNIANEEADVTIPGGTFKKYQLSSTGYENNMGFWENEDELYPNDFPDFANEKVRHHKFPDSFDRPQNKYNDIYILGARATFNVNASFLEKYSGYKIFYAERTDDNKTTFETSIGTVEKVNGNSIVARNVGEIIKGTEYLSLYPFEFLATRRRLNITHLKLVSFGVEAVDFTENFGTYATLDKTNHQDIFYSVLGSSYIDFNTENIQIALNEANIPGSFSMNGQESRVLVRLNQAVDYSVPPTKLPQSNATFNGRIPIFELVSLKRNVYNSFTQQILVDTGGVYPLALTNNSAIFGGDTFININTIKRAGSGRREIHQWVAESGANIAYRGYGDLPYQSFYPKMSVNNFIANRYKNGEFDFKGFNKDRDFSQPVDNYIKYNSDYSPANKIKPAFPFIKIESNLHPTRMARSIKTKNANEGFRTFLANDYVDYINRRGKLIKLSLYNNILLPHFERALLRTKGKEELKIGDITAFVGSGDIFAINPDEVVYTDTGFGGIQKANHSIITSYGYFFVDLALKKIFKLDGEGLKEISNAGIRNVLEGILEATTDVQLAYDEKRRRVLFSFLGENIHTFSFSPELEAWVSRHTFAIDYYFNNLTDLFLKTGTDIQVFKGNKFLPLDYTFVDNRQPDLSKIVDSLEWVADVKNDSTYFYDETLTSVRLRTLYQDTDSISIGNKVDYTYITNIRKTLNKWIINKFRDLNKLVSTPINFGTVEEPDNVDYTWTTKKRLEDNYVIVDVAYHPTKLVEEATVSDDDKQIFIHSLNVNFKPSIR